MQLSSSGLGVLCAVVALSGCVFDSRGSADGSNTGPIIVEERNVNRTPRPPVKPAAANEAGSVAVSGTAGASAAIGRSGSGGGSGSGGSGSGGSGSGGSGSGGRGGAGSAAVGGGVPSTSNTSGTGGASGAGAGGNLASVNGGRGGGAAGMRCPTNLDSDQDGVEDCVDAAPFGWQKRVTLDGAQVSATLSDFPLLVRVTDAQLGAAVRGDGSDIHFVASDARTVLDSELERYDANSGELVAWVRIPQLQAGSNTSFFLRYGDGRGDRNRPADVWPAYQYVWHLAQDPGQSGANTIKDSTRRADATPQGGMTAADRVGAVAGDGIDFDGQDDQLSFRNGLTGTGASTISAWVKLRRETNDNGAAVLVLGDEAVNRARLLFAFDTPKSMTSFGFYGNELSAAALPEDRFCYFVWTWDRTKSNVYVDGALVAGPLAHTGADTTGNAGAIGASTFSYPRFLSGTLDEVRVANRSQTAAWIATEYANQRAQSTFIKSVDAATPLPAP